MLSLCNSAVCVPVFSTGFVAPIATNIATKAKKEWSKPFKITVAAIVKNEAKNVPQWVQAARSCADEIVVVDTGSTDGTVERFASLAVLFARIVRWRSSALLSVRTARTRKRRTERKRQAEERKRDLSETDVRRR